MMQSLRFTRRMAAMSGSVAVAAGTTNRSRDNDSNEGVK